MQHRFTWKHRALAFAVSVVLLVLGIEVVAIALDDTSLDDKALKRVRLSLQPYLMFVARPGDNPTWLNAETGARIPSTMHFNALGFATSAELGAPPPESLLKDYGPGRAERLVVVTGGSVMYGLGATSNENIIAGQLERALNERTTGPRYKVLNLAMGGWIAYQQFVALSLYAAPLQPDWIVALDGHNDGGTSCAIGAGVGNPMEWPNVLHLTAEADGTGTRRDATVEWLLRNSATARVVTGARPADPVAREHEIYFDQASRNWRFSGLRFANVDRQVEFYALAERNVVDLFAHANILFVSQPLLHDNAISPWYRKAFAPNGKHDRAAARDSLRADLDAYIAKAADTPCVSNMSSVTLGYFMGRSALRLEQAVPEWARRSPGRTVRYVNSEMMLPAAYGLRMPNFIDNAHMSDLGQRRLAEYLAGLLLEADAGIPFDQAAFAASVQRAALQAVQRHPYTPPASPPGTVVAAAPVAEGVAIEPRGAGALEIEEKEGQGFHRVLWPGATTAGGKNNTLTIDVWPGSVLGVRLELVDRSGSYGRADFDFVTPLARGVVGKGVEARVEDLGNGWKRLHLTVPVRDQKADFNIALLSPDDELRHAGSAKRSIIVGQPTLQP